MYKLTIFLTLITIKLYIEETRAIINPEDEEYLLDISNT